tara:strand:- start:119 stop:457 length:339 start_codon:yes stop_codon:yes gene_type:complete
VYGLTPETTRHLNQGPNMNALIILIDQIINIYIWTLLAYIIVGWLIAFRIVNPWQPAVRMAVSVLGRIHEPILSRIRQFMPDLGGIDFSPIVVFLAAQFLRNLLVGMMTAQY